MAEKKQFISGKILFTAISEQLACSRQAVFTVTGMSMWPFICHVRDKVIVGAVKPENLQAGDIILFQAAEEKFLLHRITHLYTDYFETTGDGNLFRDGKFPYPCVIARVNQVIRNGKTMDCNCFGWKLLSRVWMALFPVRRQMLAFVRLAGKLKRLGQQVSFLR